MNAMNTTIRKQKRPMRVSTKRVYKPIDIVMVVYRVNPQVADDKVMDIVEAATGVRPSAKTVSVWKARVRKRGVVVPDLRTLTYRKW